MADEGLAGTLIGIARAGIKLSVTLHNFSETVTTAQTEIKSIANNVSLTASVLHELGVKLDQDDDDDDDDEGHQLYSSSATGTARDAARECESVFREINVIITKAMQSAAERGAKNGKVPALSPLERMKYPFLQPKMELLGANLERLKSTLVLLLNVLSYARDLKTEKDEKDDRYRKLVIDNLVRANQEATRAYETLVKRLDDQDHDGTIPEDSPKSPDRSRPTESSEKGNGGASLGLSMIKTPDSDDSHGLDASSSPRRAKAASTIQACLDRIENALVKVEQSSSVLHHSSGIAVRIELERETQTMTRLPVNAPQNAQQSSLPNPRITVSILQKQTRRRQDSLQSRTRTDSNSNSTRRNTNTNGLSRSNTWYSTLWNSMPSPYSAVSSIQQTLDNTGLFLATEQITEDAGNVLSYNLDHQNTSTAPSGGMGHGYHNSATAYAPLSAADGGDESPESADGPTLADAFRAAMPESLVVGRRRPRRADDIEMNPVGQAHHNETLRPLILPEAVESGSGSGGAHGHGHGYGQVPEVRIEPDTATATTAATSITLNDADQDQVEHANQNQNGEAAAAAAKNDNGNDWSAEQDARMMEILNASVQAAVAEGKKGLEISSPNSGTGKQTETGDDLLSDPRMAVDKKGKGKAREYEVPSSSILKTSGTGTGSAGGGGGGGGGAGGDAIDRLLGEWTTLRVSGSAAGNGHGQGEAGDD
ncbi:hypothetical protein LTR99_007850 [Exophiala xenobiotica]|uniref:Fungal N-terminal domain-containing protein n=1 Tax=Vermiconidia calcicola TaxID=1690605 RepID=A0AAV9Q6S2_9PEZI|nr:hypothetical protein LTR92_003420 [Exophiala xenobiotica]KAK5534776.1 Vesicle-Associated Membrane Protein 8 [Chaetothyriales sp. CCFEE 6169]KAK5535181.1 hypothetical protein LTR25_006189 [Vermiconidia calcicola]KAK5223827.1 hypothetical protein LTR72_005213 [Exophiala xenobiotica]KAK5289228.1 hypothetical protein LTR14_007479 [Exophiala xenobiotica]